ncbi:MAG: penicillin-binding transpeptidase domain-containing protein [Patescibacteria group bacterium]|nr:penicillin-binding transpeptidase domain-containing protein [Patescibacteria group bacterium]MCL5224026.1 penicillin-binding transpeptidase domain-containing protein [Patescibacteria group bacterium]
MAKRYLNKNIDLDETVADSAFQGLNPKEQPLHSRVFWLLLLLALMFALATSIRLITMGTLNYTHYSLLAEENANEITPIVAPRGVITDRFGTSLAENQPVFSAYLNVADMIKNSQRDAVFNAAQNILGVDSSKLSSEVGGVNFEQGGQILLLRDLSREQLIALQSLNISSIKIENDYERLYPNDSQAFSTVIGYVGQTSSSNRLQGLAGLESYYNATLQGTDGETVTPRNAQGQIEGQPTTIAPQAGQNLQTTIDGPFQDYFYNRMLSGLQQLNRTNGIGLAINPQNGQVLAMISFPTYDPNNVAAALNNPNQPLFNRAVSGQYSPGSTIKPLDAVAVLKSGNISPTQQIMSVGYMYVPNPYNPSSPSKFMDWRPQGLVDLYSAIARSCDVYFYITVGGSPARTTPLLNDPSDYGVTGIGPGSLYEWWQKFGLGKPTGIDMPGETAGFLPNPTTYEQTTGRPWLLGDTYNVAIGQGDLQVTPLQLMDYISAIANNGVAYQPSLLLNATPTKILDLSSLSPQIKQVQQGMIETVAKSYGTAYLLHTLPFSVAAKTGSAQTNNNSRVNAIFVGYAPATNPQIEVVILIENGYESILNAVPIAKDVLSWYYENRIAKNSNS